MSPDSPVAPGAPRVAQTVEPPPERVESLREWAVDGTGLTAAARVRDPAGRIALVDDAWTDGWFLPGGAVEGTETPREAARREVREETGLVAAIDRPLVVLDQTYAPADGEERFSAEFVVYAARAAGGIPAASELGVTDDEIRAARWFETVPDDLHDGDLLEPYL